MKTVLEVLFPYICLLYVMDCLVYVKAHHVLLSALFGRKFSLKKSGLHPAGLLPISRTIVTHSMPLYCTCEGIYAAIDKTGTHPRIARAKDFTFVAYKDLGPIEVEGKNIKCGQTLTIKTPSSSNARFQARLIEDLKKTEPVARQNLIQAHLSDAYDLDALQRIETANVKSAAFIKILSTLLFMLVFFVLPAALFTDLSRYIHFNALVICMLLIYFLLLLASSVTLKKMYPSEHAPRSHILLSIIFAPINAAHVLSDMTKDLFYRFNCLTIAAHFLPQKTFKELARKEMFLMDHFENEISRRDWQQFWRLQKNLLQGLLERRDISHLEFSTPPERKDQSAVFYCPFCRTEYRQKRHRCLDCEMALKAYNPQKGPLSLDASMATKS